MTVRVIIGIIVGMAAGGLMGHVGQCSSGACPLTANPYRGAIYGGVVGALIALSATGSRGGREDSPEEQTGAPHQEEAEEGNHAAGTTDPDKP